MNKIFRIPNTFLCNRKYNFQQVPFKLMKMKYLKISKECIENVYLGKDRQKNYKNIILKNKWKEIAFYGLENSIAL